MLRTETPGHTLAAPASPLTLAPALLPTPSIDSLPRRYAKFATLTEAVDYAAQGKLGINFYNARGGLAHALPYHALREQAQMHARRLLALGIKPQDRIALIAETSAPFLTLFIGATYAAALPTPLPLPTSFGGKQGYIDQIHKQLDSCAPRLALAPHGLVDMVRAAAQGLDVQVFSFEEFAALAAPDSPLPLVHSDDVAYLQYSSGSTRFPHGVMVTHRALLANCQGMGYHGVHLTDGDRVISWLPFYHDMGLVGAFLTPLTCQISADFLPTDEFVRRPMTWLAMISANPGTTLSYSPTFGYDLAARRAANASTMQLDLSRWRVAGNGGDMIRPDVMAAFAKAFAPAGFSSGAFLPSYGLAECTLAVSFSDLGAGLSYEMVDESALTGGPLGSATGSATGSTPLPLAPTRHRAVVNCGKPLPGHEVEIRDTDGKALAERAIGRVCVRGPSVMQGYFHDVEATNACLDDQRWLDTGDMGYMAGGYLFIVGRFKDLIIVNGKNHWPQDIEWAIDQLDGMKSGDAAAFSIIDEEGSESAAVLVQCRHSDSQMRATLKATILAKVRDVTGMPCRVELVPPRALPRTSSGKLARAKARALFLSGEIAPLDAVA